MRFGFDIDDTLINLREHAFHLYNRKLNTDVKIDKFHALKTVEIHEAFGLDDIKGGKMWVTHQEEIYFTDCPAFDGAKELLNQLKEDGHEIFYITSRPKEYCQKTRDWLKEYDFPVEDQNFYCGMKDQEKIEIIKDLKLDYYFDDKPLVLQTLRDVPTKVYVRDQSYNQDVSFPRVKNWMEFQY